MGSSYGGKVALEVAARRPDTVAALVLLCSALPGHEPSDVLRSFAEQEEALIEADDIAGAVELNVKTWLGPEADDAVREQVRRMQRRGFDVQLAAAEEFAPTEAEVDLSLITAPCLALSGGHDLPDFRGMPPGCRNSSPTPVIANCPGRGTFPTWSGPPK